jgi:hypothetical protein
MMRSVKPGRKKSTFILILVVCLIIGFVWYIRPPTRPEPVYRGKTLTKWLKQLDDGEAFGISSSALPSPTPAQVEAAGAIHAIGVEAVPLLLKDIHVRPTTNSFRVKFEGRLNSLLKHFSNRRVSLTDLTEEDRTRWRAAQGLAALGPLAKPAVPELEKLLYTNMWHSSIKEAAYALSVIEPEGINILTNAVRPQTEWSGMCAIWALGQHPATGTNVIPFLIRVTTSPSEGTACGAIQVLGLFHTDAEHVIPALTNALFSTNATVGRDAAHALGQFGPQADAAAPLLKMLTNNPTIGASAREALEKIQTRPVRFDRN